MQRGVNFTEAVDLTNEVDIPKNVSEFAGPYSTIHKGICRGEYVAVKILRPLGVPLHSMRRKVYRERTVWANLQHPNIIPLYGYTEETELFGPFGALISPWYQAGDASKFLKERGAGMSHMSRIWMWLEVVKGVRYLHSRKPTIIHGDLKPNNILIDDEGRPRICDFGLVSILMEEGFTGMTTTSPYTGTERYLAPELLEDDANRPTTASDIWALACVGLEFIFGLLPYARRQHNRSGMIFRDMASGVLPAAQPDSLEQPYLSIWQLMINSWQWNPGNRPTASNIQLHIESLRFGDTAIPNPDSTVSSARGSDSTLSRRGQRNIALLEDKVSRLIDETDSQAAENENLRELLARFHQENIDLIQAHLNSLSSSSVQLSLPTHNPNHSASQPYLRAQSSNPMDTRPWSSTALYTDNNAFPSTKAQHNLGTGLLPFISSERNDMLDFLGDLDAADAWEFNPKVPPVHNPSQASLRQAASQDMNTSFNFIPSPSGKPNVPSPVQPKTYGAASTSSRTHLDPSSFPSTMKGNTRGLLDFSSNPNVNSATLASGATSFSSTSALSASPMYAHVGQGEPSLGSSLPRRSSPDNYWDLYLM